MSTMSLYEMYKNDEQDARQFAEHGLHKEAAMYWKSAASLRILHTKTSHSATFDKGHFEAWEYCKEREAYHSALAQ